MWKNDTGKRQEMTMDRSVIHEKKQKKPENTGCSEAEVSHQVCVHTSIGERNTFTQIALPHRSFGQNFRGSCDRRWHVTVDWNAYTVMRVIPALKPYATCVTCTKDRTIFHNPHTHIHRILSFCSFSVRFFAFTKQSWLSLCHSGNFALCWVNSHKEFLLPCYVFSFRLHFL